MSNENIKKAIRTISIDELIEQEGSRDIVLSTDSNKKNPTKEEMRELKKENRYYLPVLHLNHMDMYPSKPNSERQHWTDEKAMETCLGNCCGIPGTKAMCCKLNPEHLEHVIGPVDEEWIKKTIQYFKKKGITMTRQDLVIDYEEGVLIGQNFFNGHRIFESKDAFPIMRMKLEGPHFACIFLNSKNNMCNIYEVRPELCRVYLCGYVKSNFFVKGKRKQNVWEKLDTRPKDEEEK